MVVEPAVRKGQQPPWIVPVEPLLPRVEWRYRYPGRRRLDDRKVLSGILFVLYTGISWEFLPQELGFGSDTGAISPDRGNHAARIQGSVLLTRNMSPVIPGSSRTLTFPVDPPYRSCYAPAMCPVPRKTRPGPGAAAGSPRSGAPRGWPQAVRSLSVMRSAVK